MTKLPKHINMKNHFINLINDKQSPYGPIYILNPVEFEMLKTYIEINLGNGFIHPSKWPASAPILFIHQNESIFWLCIDYQGFNNLSIKIWYLLLLIGKLLNYLVLYLAGFNKCILSNINPRRKQIKNGFSNPISLLYILSHFFSPFNTPVTF